MKFSRATKQPNDEEQVPVVDVEVRYGGPRAVNFDEWLKCDDQTASELLPNSRQKATRRKEAAKGKENSPNIVVFDFRKNWQDDDWLAEVKKQLPKLIAMENPCVLRGLADHWPACTKWTDEYLKKNVPEDIEYAIKSMKGGDTKLTFAKYLARYRQEPLHMCSGSTLGDDASPIDFALHQDCKDLHPCQSKFEQHRELFKNTIIEACSKGGEDAPSTIFWMGFGRNLPIDQARDSTASNAMPIVTKTHLDDYYTVSACVGEGQKIWYLWLPIKSFETPNLAREVRPDGKFNTSLAKQYTKIVLRQGDVFINPPKWWHFVHTVDRCLVVNWWFPVTNTEVNPGEEGGKRNPIEVKVKKEQSRGESGGGSSSSRSSTTTSGSACASSSSSSSARSSGSACGSSARDSGSTCGSSARGSGSTCGSSASCSSASSSTSSNSASGSSSICKGATRQKPLLGATWLSRNKVGRILGSKASKGVPYRPALSIRPALSKQSNARGSIDDREEVAAESEGMDLEVAAESEGVDLEVAAESEVGAGGCGTGRSSSSSSSSSSSNSQQDESRPRKKSKVAKGGTKGGTKVDKAVAKKQVAKLHVSAETVAKLHDACREGKLDILKGILEGRDAAELIEEREGDCDNGYWTPLHHACYYGKLECVKELVKHEADVHAVVCDGVSGNSQSMALQCEYCV
jgi:hypothetical protein